MLTDDDEREKTRKNSVYTVIRHLHVITNSKGERESVVVEEKKRRKIDL